MLCDVSSSSTCAACLLSDSAAAPPPNHQKQLTGHFHAGAAAEVNGTHYVTLEGLVEAPSGSNAFAVVTIGADAITIRAGGYASSRVLPLPPYGGPAVAAAAKAAVAADEGDVEGAALRSDGSFTAATAGVAA